MYETSSVSVSLRPEPFLPDDPPPPPPPDPDDPPPPPDPDALFPLPELVDLAPALFKGFVPFYTVKSAFSSSLNEAIISAFFSYASF